LDQPTVLIVSDSAEFSSAVTGRWQSERNTPAFTLMRGDLCRGLDPESFDAAVVGPVRRSAVAGILSSLEPAAKPLLLVSEESQALRTVREKHPRAMVLQQHDGWLDALILVMGQALQRCEAQRRAQHAEEAQATLRQHAALGGYMLEMRHSLNNALTSILGNSELLLSEPGSLSAAARSQADTIRDMSMRMHEILQRFSSLEKELRVVERQTEKEGKRGRGAKAGA
jgi:signal transduction histidine kinase